MTQEERDQLAIEAFLTSKEGEDWQDFTEAVDRELAANPDAQTIEVPTAFLREAIADIKTNPLMFLHMKEAHDREQAAAGKAEGQ